MTTPGVELIMACDLMARFEARYEGTNLTSIETLTAIRAYAAIAQSEAAQRQAAAMERIADMLSIYLSDYDPNGNEAMGRTSEDTGY